MRCHACFAVCSGPCPPDARLLTFPDTVRFRTYLNNHNHWQRQEAWRKGTQLEAKRLGSRWPGIKRSACSFTRPTLRPAPARSALFKHDGSGRWMRAAPNMAFRASVTSRTAETDGILVACYHAAPARPAAGYTAVHLPQHSIAPPPHLPPRLSSPPRVPLDTYTPSPYASRALPSFSPWYLHLASRGWPHLTCRKSSDTFVRGHPFRLVCGRAGTGKDSV